ncbi:MAG: hypothetical protein ACI837_003244 [Crocinitomicaceae bacterium]|jgi:hypothetical protein
MFIWISPKISKSGLFVGTVMLMIFSSCLSDDAKNSANHKENGVESGPWFEFKTFFPQLDLPCKTPMEIDAKLFSDLPEISKEQLEIIQEDSMGFGFRFPVMNQFYAYGKVYETEKFLALVYVRKNAFLEKIAPLSYTLATFTIEGKLIEKLIIGGSEFLDENYHEAEFKKNHTISVINLKPIYKRDIEEYGFMDNPIVSMKQIEKRTYKIDDGGKFRIE